MRFGETCSKMGTMLITYYGQMYDLRDDIDYGNFIMECRWAYHSYKNGILRRMNDLRAIVGKRGEYDGRPLAWGFMRNPEIPWRIQVYEPHAVVVREQLYPRFIELDFNQSKLAREFGGVDLFPPIPSHLSKWFHTPKKPEPNGWYCLNRFGLLSILCNPMYIGWWGYLGNWKQGNHPTILDEDIFWTVFYHVSAVDIDGTPIVRVKRYEQTKTVECPVLLRRLLFGEEQGQHVVTYPNRKKAGEKILSWGYRLFDQSAPHTRKLLANLQSSVIDHAVVERLLLLLQYQRVLEDYQTRMQRQMAQEEKRRGQQQEELESIEKGLKGALRIMEDGDVDDQAYNEAKRKRKELLARKHRLEAELRKEHPVKKVATTSPLSYKDLLVKVREKWDSGIFTIADKRQLLSEFLEKVTVYKLSAHFYRLRIYWHITEQPEELLLWYPDGDRPLWTEEEEAKLRTYYPNKEKLMEALPTRTWASILRHAWETGLAKANPRLSRAAYMPLEDLLTHQDKQVMIYYEVNLDEVSKGKPVSMLWSSRYDDSVSISTNPF